jgi:hypothetical protein
MRYERLGFSRPGLFYGPIHELPRRVVFSETCIQPAASLYGNIV